jgi:hypothetical protein
MANVKCDDEKLAFSVFHLRDMLGALMKEYLARHHGELKSD